MKKNNKNINKKPFKTNYKESWLFFLKYYNKNKKESILIVIFCFLISITTISLPFLSTWISDAAKAGDGKMLFQLSIFIIGIGIIKIVLNFFINYMSGLFDSKIELVIREEMMSKIHRLSMETFDNTAIGIFFSRILNDLKEVKNYASNLIKDVVTIFCLVIGGFAFIFIIDWIAGLITLSIYLITLIIYAIFKQNLVYHQQLNKTLNTAISIGFGEHIQMITEIKSFSNSKSTLKKFNSLQEKYYNSTKKYIKKTSFFKVTGIATSVIVSTTVLILGSFLALEGIITISEVVGLVMASNILIIPIELSSSLVTDMITMNATVVRINEFFGWKFESDNGKIKKEFKGKIEFKNVNFSYKTNESSIQIFQDLNLIISPNQGNLIYGECAKGKSTIFKLIMRYYEIDSGEILIDGINIKDYDIDFLRKNIAYIATIPKLFSSTLEIDGFFTNKKRYQEITSSLGLENLINKEKEFNLDRFINSQGLQVSDGEKQMLSLARALYFDSFVILLDFNEKNLSDSQVENVKKTLKIYAKNKTLVISSDSKESIFKIDKYIEIK